MAREIVIDSDTLVGYSFPLKEFYVSNKGFTTYRTTTTNTKEVLDIVAPSNTVTLEDLQDLQDTMEPLKSLKYTWDDTGAYIRTIQINTYEENPVTLDAEKKKLYIMNSNLIFDLTLNEGKNYRLLYLISYFADNLGVTLTLPEMDAIYSELISFYTPTVYNKISSYRNSDNALDLKYSNEFALSNFSKTALAEYLCTFNPYNTYTPSSYADIVYINSEVNTIQLTDPSLIEGLKVGESISIEGASVVLDGNTEYSADGTYTISALTDSLIRVQEQIPVSYTTEYLTLYKVVAENTIEAIDRDKNLITLSTLVPSTIKVGDVVYIKGANISIEGEEVSADGEYIVSYINEDTLQVQSTIPASYTYIEGTQKPVLYKKKEVAYISSISSNIVTLFSAPTDTLEAGYIVEINNSLYTIASVSTSDLTITLTNSPDPYTLVFPTLSKQVPDELTKINVTSTTVSTFPVGEFMLDTFNQCKSYINLIPFLPAPTEATKRNLYEEVPLTRTISIEGEELTMEFMGLYSMVYEDKTT